MAIQMKIQMFFYRLANIVFEIPTKLFEIMERHWPNAIGRTLGSANGVFEVRLIGEIKNGGKAKQSTAAY